MNLMCAILAGGKSRRMGCDKAWIEIDGIPMIERVLRAALEFGLNASIVGRESDEIPVRFRKQYPSIRIIPDMVVDAGPVGGLLTALELSVDFDAIVLLPCDAPYISHGSIKWLCDLADARLLQGEKQGVIPLRDGRFEPLFAVYSTSIKGVVHRYFETNGRENMPLSMKGLLNLLDCEFVELPREHLNAVQDCDTPDQLKRMCGA